MEFPSSLEEASELLARRYRLWQTAKRGAFWYVTVWIDADKERTEMGVNLLAVMVRLLRL